MIANILSAIQRCLRQNTFNCIYLYIINAYVKLFYCGAFKKLLVKSFVRKLVVTKHGKCDGEDSVAKSMVFDPYVFEQPRPICKRYVLRLKKPSSFTTPSVNSFGKNNDFFL